MGQVHTHDGLHRAVGEATTSVLHIMDALSPTLHVSAACDKPDPQSVLPRACYWRAPCLDDIALCRSTFSPTYMSPWSPLPQYVLSTCLTIYNKLLVSKDDNLLDAGPFPAPLLMTAVQFMFQAMACAAVRRNECSETWHALR